MTKGSPSTIAGLTIAFVIGIGMELYISSGQASSVFAAVLVPLPVLSCLFAGLVAGRRTGMFDHTVVGLPRMQVVQSPTADELEPLR